MDIRTPSNPTASPSRTRLAASRRLRAVLGAAGVVALTAACGSAAGQAASSDDAVEQAATTSQAEATTADRAATHHEEGDAAWDAATATEIRLAGGSATAEASSVRVDGSTVTITEAGTYLVSGTLTDGRLVVATTDEDLVRIVLDGADVSSSSGPALEVVEADEVVVVLADGSTNALTGGAESSAALDSTADLTIAGTGLLVADGTVNDAIASSDGLVVVDATIEATAVDDGIRGKDYLVVEGATITVDSGGDGLVSDNTEDVALGFVTLGASTLEVVSAGDGVQAATDLDVTGGDVTITAGGGSTRTLADDTSAKGLKAGVALLIADGTVVVDAADDALHSNDSITVTGGGLTLATGDDGIHADSSLAISAGTIEITASYEGLESAVIAVDGGDITVRASDDGINVSGDADPAEFGPGGGPGGGAGGRGAPGTQVQGTATDEAATTGEQSLTVRGGSITVDADGDGVDVNGSLVMTGGSLVVHGPTAQMNGALDAQAIQVSGGTLVAAGSAGMAQTPGSSSTQATVGVRFGSGLAAGSVVTVTAEDGATVLTFTTTKVTETLVVSSPDLVSGATYTVAVDGSDLGSTTAA